MQIHLYSATARGRFGSVLKDIFGVLVLGELLNVSRVTMDAAMAPPWYRPLPHDAAATLWEGSTYVERTAHFGFETPERAVEALPWFSDTLCIPTGFRVATPPVLAAWERDGRVPLGTLDRIVARMQFPTPTFPSKQGAVVHARRGDRASVGRRLSPLPLVEAMMQLGRRATGSVRLLTEPLNHQDLDALHPQPKTLREDAEAMVFAPVLLFVNGESAFTTMLSLLRSKPTVVVGACLDELVRCDVVRPERGDVRLAIPLPELQARPPEDLYRDLWMKRGPRQHPQSLGPQWVHTNATGGVWKHLWAAAVSVPRVVEAVRLASFGLTPRTPPVHFTTYVMPE